MEDVLREQDALKFQQEEVDDLFDILLNGLDGLLRDGVVLAGPNGAGEAFGQNDSADDFNRSRDWTNDQIRDPKRGSGSMLDSQPKARYRNLNVQRRRGR